MAINYLEQKRLIFAKEKSKARSNSSTYSNMMKKVPAYIQTNGLLYTLAFLLEKEKDVLDDIWEWHCNSEWNPHQLMAGVEKGAFFDQIFEVEDSKLRALTLETLALLRCTRRFAKEENIVNNEG